MGLEIIRVVAVIIEKFVKTFYRYEGRFTDNLPIIKDYILQKFDFSVILTQYYNN